MLNYYNNSQNISANGEAMNQVITNPSVLAQNYIIRDGFVFTAIRHPANVYNAIVIRNPSNARRWGDSMAASVHSLEEHIAFINENKIEFALVIAEEIDFINRCPTLNHLNIIPAETAKDHFDYSPLYKLSGIQSIYCATEYGKFDEMHTEVDYSQIKELQSLSVSTQYDLNFSSIETLKSLKVSNYNQNDISHLFCSKNMDTLQLLSCKIQSLNGIENAPGMQCVYLHNNRFLNDISQLVSISHSLKALSIQNCSKITDFSVLEKLENLEYLVLQGNNTLSSLSFIYKLPKLKTFIFDMSIADADLTPCLNLSYVHCGKMKRQYNVTAKMLPKGDYYRGNETIDIWRRVQ